MTKEEGTYLGFDLSTQKLKAVQLGTALEVIATAEVKFDTDLPEFRTSGGVNVGENNNEYYVQPVMWIKAVDIILDRLVVQGADLSTVVGISGSAQQHGSVYWSRKGIETLKNLDPDKFLHVQLDASAFTVNHCPIWMDSSTEKQCLEMEAAIGGRNEMVTITGSKCYQRFTGPQIRKIYQNYKDAYEHTIRISLISSFLASIFLGDIAPIDYADGSGMNLLDINKKIWSSVCLNACAPDLELRLGTPVPTNTVVGNISLFFSQRFNIPAYCKVSAFTGDNPSAISGMLVENNSLVVSLGTSDVVMMSMEKPLKLNEGHVFCHPTIEDKFMGLLCFRNGSLVRDIFVKVEGNNSWDNFNELLDSTPRGNYGNMALHFVAKEIIPVAKGTIRWNKDHCSTSREATESKGLTKFSSPQTEIRAMIEGQMLHHKAIAADFGFNFGMYAGMCGFLIGLFQMEFAGEDTKIIATGGGSVNKSILQVIADVFNAPVYVQKESEAALMGAGYRAKYCKFLDDRIKEGIVSHEEVRYRDYIIRFIPNYLQRVCDPSKDSEQIYTPMLGRYREMAKILEESTIADSADNLQ